MVDLTQEVFLSLESMYSNKPYMAPMPAKTLPAPAPAPSYTQPIQCPPVYSKPCGCKPPVMTLPAQTMPAHPMPSCIMPVAARPSSTGTILVLFILLVIITRGAYMQAKVCKK